MTRMTMQLQLCQAAQRCPLPLVVVASQSAPLAKDMSPKLDVFDPAANFAEKVRSKNLKS